MKLKTIPIFLSFFIMGFGDAVGTLVGFATREYELSKFMAGFLPFFALLAYGIFSVPVGILASNKGKKFVLLVGLVITLIGELIPVISISRYFYLLLAVFFVGTGMTVLQVAGNPLMRDVSSEGMFPRNLTFAQFIKGIGMTSAPYVVPLVIALGFTWTAIFPVYSIVIIITFITIFSLKVGEKPDLEESERTSLKTSFKLLTEPYVLLMVLGIFLYVGAEVGLNSWIATYLHSAFGYDLENVATLGIGFFLTAITVGRLLGTIILNYLPAKRFFLYCSIIGFVSLLCLFMGIESVAVAAIFVSGMVFGNIFPLIFSILIESKPERSSELSGLMCMAIIGGALMPLIMGFIADYSVMASFLIPLFSFAYIIYLAIKSLKMA